MTTEQAESASTDEEYVTETWTYAGPRSAATGSAGVRGWTARARSGCTPRPRAALTWSPPVSGAGAPRRRQDVAPA